MNEVTAQVMKRSRSGMEYWSIETGDKNSRGCHPEPPERGVAKRGTPQDGEGLSADS